MTNIKGTTLRGMIDAFQSIGFDAKAVRADVKGLTDLPQPMIAHVVVNGSLQHYVVIYGTNATTINVMDPSDGQVRCFTHDDFKKIWAGIIVMATPGANFRQGLKTISTTKRFWDLICSRRISMLKILLGTACYAVISFTTAVYVMRIVDDMMTSGDLNSLNVMSLSMLVLLCSQIVISYQKNITTLSTGQSVDSALIMGYYKHLLKLPLQFFTSMRTSEIFRGVNDAIRIRSFISDRSAFLADQLLTVIFSVALMLLFDWRLAFVAVLSLPIYWTIYSIAAHTSKILERRLIEDAAVFESEVTESINLISTIKSFRLENYIAGKTEHHFSRLKKSAYASEKNNIIYRCAIDLTSKSFTIVLLWMGARYVLLATITPGELLCFYILFLSLTAGVNNIVGSNKIAQNAFISGDRFFGIMDLKAEEGILPLSVSLCGPIVLNNIHFRYDGRENILADLSIQIPEGKITALVGESGCGKSSILGVIQKLYPIQAGNIQIGEHDINCLSDTGIRAVISAVPQKIEFLPGTISENIMIGDDHPDIEKMIGLCNDLGMIEFINRLPEGFNTPLRKNGSGLSAGERQRIAVARALYKSHTILVLDEATSSLDDSAAAAIETIIQLERKNKKTIITVTHRLTTLLNADQIIVLQKGKVAETGTHKELMSARGYYFSLSQNGFRT